VSDRRMGRPGVQLGLPFIILWPYQRQLRGQNLGASGPWRKDFKEDFRNILVSRHDEMMVAKALKAHNTSLFLINMKRPQCIYRTISAPGS